MQQSDPITVGIVGGIGPESTVDYYKGIINAYQTAFETNNYPPIIINSINMTQMLALIDNKDYAGVTDLLLRSVTALSNAGAHFAVIASNTPHVVFDKLQDLAPIPLISIVEATCIQAATLGLKRLLLIGTRFTMQHHFYETACAQHNISTVVPSPEQQELIHHIIFSELEHGIVIPAQKARIKAICNTIIENEGCDGIILGCTELPLMFHAEDFSIAVLNTTQIHIETIVNRLAAR